MKRKKRKKRGWNDNENDFFIKKKIDNNIGDSGAKMISEGLKSNSTLIYLSLQCDRKEGSNKKFLKKGKRESNVWQKIVMKNDM